jgi:ABC-type transporter Mla MlaB component
MAGNSDGRESLMAQDPLAELDGCEIPGAGPTQGVDPSSRGTEQAADRVDLGDSLTIPDVGQVHERLRAALDLGALRIAAGDLTQVDAAGVQLLCALVKSARAEARALAWDGVSERLREAVRQLGLESELAFDR